jgi:hypothetical protein
MEQTEGDDTHTLKYYVHFEARTVSQCLIYADKKEKVHIEDIKKLEHERA